MNQPEHGWASYAQPIESIQSLIEQYAVTVGPWGVDQFGPCASVCCTPIHGGPVYGGRRRFRRG
jgi:hypothetical protein